jgi:hypothetical protein
MTNERLRQSIEQLTNDTATEWQAGYEAGVEASAKALADDARRCDCFAFEYNECSCGAWDDYKTITSARAVEIVLTLKGKDQ